MMFGVSPPPKNSLARIFTPPRKRRRVELVVGRFPPSREWKKGREWRKGGGDEERGREWGKESGNGIYFLPPAACGGGCERKAVAGGGELAMMFGVSPPPKNSLARIFTPPRKRRRVELVVGRFPPSREWKKGAGMEKGAGMKAGRK